jgi:hypothetical protein
VCCNVWVRTNARAEKRETNLITAFMDYVNQSCVAINNTETAVMIDPEK